MLNTLFQIVCSFLAAVGILFVVIELRTRHDRSNLYFGICNLLFCAFASIDLWVLPRSSGVASFLYWTRIQHTISVFIIPLLFQYIFIFTGEKRPAFIRAVWLGSLLFTAMFFHSSLLAASNQRVVTGIVYQALFVPYSLGCMIALLAFIVRGLRSAQPADKRILVFHLVGFGAVVFCGFLDLLTLLFVGSAVLPIQSFTILGVLGFGAMNSLVFTERFLYLLRDRQHAYEKLEGAFRDLEEVNSLKELGKSSAIINHEIRNYLFMISGQAELIKLKEALSERGAGRVDNILNSIQKLNTFSQDILDLSKSQIIRSKSKLDVCGKIRECIERNFADRQSAFHIDSLTTPHFIYGDWEKLEHVFLNIFKNAFEAASSEPLRIVVRVVPGPHVVLITVEDNGTGCTREQLDGLFRAFYTTKKGRMGTGLGMSITRTIVESHGGFISAYSKNLTGTSDHGIKLEIVFPNYASPSEAPEEKQPILLVKDGLENMEAIIRVFRNVRVTPHVIQRLSDARHRQKDLPKWKILINPKAYAAMDEIRTPKSQFFFLQENAGIPYVLAAAKAGQPAAFSEEYVLNNLL